MKEPCVKSGFSPVSAWIEMAKREKMNKKNGVVVCLLI